MTHRRGNVLEAFTSEERGRYYRAAAQEALRAAQAATSESLKATYLQLAAGWQKLLLGLEAAPRKSGRDQPDLAAPRPLRQPRIIL
jgi:hypothetical protein